LSQKSIGYQRIRACYRYVQSYIAGASDILEILPKEGVLPEGPIAHGKNITAYVQLSEHIDSLKEQYPESKFLKSKIPSLTGISDDQLDLCLAFRVLERIKDDDYFLREVARTLKPKGYLVLSVPNPSHLLTYNPFFYQDYDQDQLKHLLSPYFSEIQIFGVNGSDKVKAMIETMKRRVDRLNDRKWVKTLNGLPRSIKKPIFKFLKWSFNQSKSFRLSNNPKRLDINDLYISKDLEGAMEFLVIARH
jgi:SAM-dependent methyltransferase